MAENIVNIINFVRGVEPRENVDLVMPVIEQKKLLKHYRFPGTFLLQYDALCDDRFVSLMKEDNEGNEVGVWLEIVEPLCEAVGIQWRGRFPWDWHANVGFSVGYTPREREILVDALFERFKGIFSYYPRVMGSWIIDAHTLAYAAERYGLDASVNCKDQWGTDGYTLWGAYYNGGYYPAKNNVFAVGESREKQIDVPIFRMLGSDPVLQYDAGLDISSGAAAWQGVITLEPVYKRAGGGDPAWVDWYLRENFNGECLAYSYTQVGQENSFGWEAMKAGLFDQFEKLSQNREKYRIETLGTTGRWFQKTYAVTPATAIVCHDDFEKSGKQSAWYNGRHYRANLYDDGKGVRLRDLMLFDNDSRERYLDGVETTPVLQFETLPIIDGNRMSGSGIRAGGYLLVEDERALLNTVTYAEEGETLILTLSTDRGKIVASFAERRITFTQEEGKRVTIEILYDKNKPYPYEKGDEWGLSLYHNGCEYGIDCEVIAYQLGKIVIGNSLTIC